MKLSIIIPTKDRGEVFNHTLQCAANAIQSLDAEIVVVNDSKTSQPIIPKEFKMVRLIQNPKQGVASARNIGVKESQGELLLFLDDDIIISKDSIDHVINLHNQFSQSCFNVNWEYPAAMQESMELSQFGRFMKAHQLTSFKGWYSDTSWKDGMLFSARSVASFHLSIFRKDFEKTNGYNEQFPHAGFEDYDFPIQLQKSGLSFYIDSRITVFHNEADRMNLNNWLNSQERRATTRNVAVELGFKELALEYGIFKRNVLRMISFYPTVLLMFLKLIPNYKLFDSLYFKLLSILQASRIFKGYTSR